MKARTLGRHIREGSRNLIRNRWMTFASIASVMITLIILGVFLIFAINMNHIVGQVENQVEIRAFLNRGTDADTVKNIEAKMKAIPHVAEVKFIPKEEGLEALIAKFDDGERYLGSLREENPLPDAFEIHADIPQRTSLVAQEIEKIDTFYKVEYGQGKVEKLFKATTTMRNIGIVFIVGLAFTAMFLIANTIKLTIVSRRKEIAIMRLVGATNNFIRWPFFVEGLLLGLIGSLIPITLLSVGYYYLLGAVHGDISLYWFELLPMSTVATQVFLTLLGIGIFIGVWGSLVSVRRFLRV
ncbi:permease-like cell division protein FtsX [Rubeoparvulum massiliense]|uniref:permease-like cell division protein FtsX n=1 Tax=Rubeoparvulum massiliense TaxID=1631346 RepID=UPI00065DE8F2|nr:permease-like cell division protein FtsX [Rubeoparvulum massiliense]